MDDVSKTVFEWAAGVVGALLALVYKKHESELAGLHDLLRTKVGQKEYDEAQERGQNSRTELRDGMIKIFDKLDQQARETQTKFESLMAVVTHQHLSLLSELNKKADK
jgi:hypothetical protein